MAISPQETLYLRLAERIRATDAAAEEELFGMFHKRIRGFAIAHTRDTTLADDLAQEVVWAVIRALRDGKVQQPAGLPAFVLGTARNLLANRIRERSRSRTEPLTGDMESSIPAPPAADFERHHSARQAIQRLEPHERAVLLLSLVDGLSPEEIADRLNITAESVRKRKSRALRRLWETLGRGSQSAGPRLL
jgi:RNA polymerase sigma-70 factor (ECF subfamily)